MFYTIRQRGLLIGGGGWLAGTFFLISQAYATAEGLYFGIRLGPVHSTSRSVLAASKSGSTRTEAWPKSDQLSASVLVGYQFNDYIGLEGEGIYFSGIRYRVEGVQFPKKDLTINADTINLMGKVELPLGPVSLFAKGGMALTWLRTPKTLNSPSYEWSNDQLVRPIVAVGMSYALSSRWVTDFTFTRVRMGEAVKRIDMYTLGIQYHFVDEYCGQFLC